MSFVISQIYEIISFDLRSVVHYFLNLSIDEYKNFIPIKLTIDFQSWAFNNFSI